MEKGVTHDKLLEEIEEGVELQKDSLKPQHLQYDEVDPNLK